jgi:hypothetical protein
MSTQSAYTFRIEVFTTGLFIVGSYELPLYRRLSDALNGDPRRYLTLRDAAVAPLSYPQQAQRVPELLVERAEALLVAVIEEPPPPPDYYSRDEVERSQVPRAAQPMLFFTAAFAVRGHFYQRPDLGLAEALERSSDDFLPLSNVQVFPLAGGQATTRGFACLNRARINALCLVPGAALSAPGIPNSALPTVPPVPPPPLPDAEHPAPAEP